MNIFNVICFQNIIKNIIKNFFSDIASSSVAKCEERKKSSIVSKFSPQNCLFYRTEIHGFVLKQPIKIKQIPN